MVHSIRIQTFLHSFEPGGVERVALRLCAAWAEAGLDARLLLGREEGAMRDDAPLLAWQTAPDPGFSTAAVETPWMMAWLARLLRRQPAEALFCAGNSYTIVACAMKLLLGDRCPPIVAKVSNCLIRDDLPAIAKPFYRAWCRIQGRLIDRFVALSPAMRAEVIAAMDVPAARVSIIANPVLSQAELAALVEAGRRSRATAGEGRRFLAAGRLVAQKDFAMLIAAFANGSRPADTLTIIGEGPDRRALETLAAKLGVADRVSLPGHQNRPERWFARADCLVLSSRYEGLPAVVVEALAAGLPIIATDCCASMAELVGHGAFGTLVPVGDGRALAEAIAGARAPLATPDAARAVAARHAVEVVAEDYIRLFTLLIKDARDEAMAEPRPRHRLFTSARQERSESV